MASLYQTKLNRILGDGARATKFAVIGIDDPFNINKEKYLMIKSAQFPGKYHDVIDFKFKGRNIPLRGQTRYDNTWTCVFYLEESHSLRDMFMMWIESLDQKHNMDSNQPSAVINAQSKNNSQYNTTLTIAQVNFDDDTQVTGSYQLYNVFPKSISQVELDYSDVGRILEYTVEFSYTHFQFMTYDQSNGTEVDRLRSAFLNGIEGIVGSIKNNVTNVLADVIGSAKSGFTSSFNSSNISGTTLGSIGNSVSSGMGSLVKGSGNIFSGVDFSPANFIDK